MAAGQGAAECRVRGRVLSEGLHRGGKGDGAGTFGSDRCGMSRWIVCLGDVLRATIAVEAPPVVAAQGGGMWVREEQVVQAARARIMHGPQPHLQLRSPSDSSTRPSAVADRAL